jgi:cellulose synthase/poly-beta-1,6-N-acetylglucosamine synthase-like glycosyltransferase
MSATPSSWPMVTVIIPVRNEERFIGQTLSQIAEQDYPHDRLEVIVADGMSDDTTPQLVREFAATHPGLTVRLVPNPKRLSSAGRNLAVTHGQGDYFLLVDGHVCIPSRTLISDMVTVARRLGARVLGRPQPLSPPDINDFQAMVALARESPIAHSQESFIYSAYEGWTSPISIGVMYRRDVFDEVGHFDERFDAAEDLEFNYRIERRGIRCYTAPRFAVMYYPRDSFTGLFRQMRRYGTGRAAFVLKHPERFRVETVVPAGFVAALTVLSVAGFFRSEFWLVLAVLLAVYGAVLFTESLRLLYRRRRRFSFRVPAVIACVHVGLGLGFLAGIGRSLRRWQKHRQN